MGNGEPDNTATNQEAVEKQNGGRYVVTTGQPTQQRMFSGEKGREWGTRPDAGSVVHRNIRRVSVRGGVSRAKDGRLTQI